MGLESDQLQQCIDEVRIKRWEQVFGTVPYFRETNLDFLAQLPNVMAAQFWDIDLQSIDGLYTVEELCYLRISGRRPSLNFQKLPHLRKLVWEWNRKDIGCATLGALVMLHLWHYKSQTADFSRLELPTQITELGIFWSNVETLGGLGPLSRLRHLEVARCRNLAAVLPLAECAPNLEHLVITACGRVNVDDAKRLAEKLPRLTHFYAANTLIVSR